MEAAGPRYRQWLEPSLPAMLWIVLILVLTGASWRTAMVTSDGDPVLWWRVGDWMIQHREVMRSDPFSFTKPGAPFVAKEWLASVAFAAAGNAWGLYGLAVLAAVLIATTFALLLRLLLREGVDPLTAFLLTVFAAGVASMHWLARPHLFSFLLFQVSHAALRLHRREKDTAWLGIVLGLTALLWANLHGGFVMLFVLLAAHAVEAAFTGDRQRLMQLGLVAGICSVATLLNPNGWNLHWHTWQFLQSKFLTGWIIEYASPDFHSASMRGLLLWFGLLFVVLTLLRPRWRIADGLLLMVFGYFTLYSRRNIPFFALVTAPMLAGPVSEWLCRHWTRWAAAAARLAGIMAHRNGWLTVLSLGAALLLWQRPVEFAPEFWPADALRVVKAEPRVFRGPVFNQYIWGSYLLRELPGTRVFVDSRTDFYGEDAIREFDTVTRLQPDWQAILAKHRVTWTLMPSNHRLNAALAVAPGWKHRYQDEVATIYVRTAPW